ncbi:MULTISPECIES: cardiolipin synthase [unclassified Clostridium]|uniref:cardiolipin synthase n=1 Tax=unclassified Clostridium TaxID=2614128 RepID=UPI00189757D0|nr:MULTISPECIES: cardiolipin synthase [unclassified Clostridium]MBP3914856.1 cardiolipin synthase [Clostridium sp.]
MKSGRKKAFNVIYGRVLMIIALLVIQITILGFAFMWLSEDIPYIYGGFTVLTAILVIYILNKNENPSFKLAWIVLFVVSPVFGALFYLFVKFQVESKLINYKLLKIIDETQQYLSQDKKVIAELEEVDMQVANLAKYMVNIGGYPIYKNTDIEYFSLGEEKFKEMKKQIKKAQKFIFMEYFIVEESYMWNSILELLEEKVKEGVEVRFMYDGMCSLSLLPYNYPDFIKEKGIKCKMFSPIKPVLSTAQNNRDHRKILVIDGKVAFNGGINLGDEYINRIEKYGHWKDTAIMLTGDAVKSFTLMFLQMWNINEKNHDDFEKYISIEKEEQNSIGYVMPYGDSPLDNENVGENVYLDILATAKRYVHIMTPYLIIDNEMMIALTYAAKRGIDIKLILPSIPDKKSAFMLARTYYPELIRAGVKIYEYTPGFVHAKVFSSDDEKAVVGTINLDFRSLYLHFECATFFYKTNTVKYVENDFQNTLAACKLITIEDYNKLNIFYKIGGGLLKLIAPLM